MTATGCLGHCSRSCAGRRRSSQTLTLTATSTNVQTGLVCTQLTALYPCGDGPGAFNAGHGGS